MRKIKRFLSMAVISAMLVLVTYTPSSADCPPHLPYIGTYIPFYELGEQVGVQCVVRGNICKCIGEYYYW